MLAKKYRLNKNFFTSKKSPQNTLIRVVTTPIASVKIYKSEKPYSRYAVVIGAKVFKKAVERNRLKRVFYEYIRSKNLWKKTNQDFVIYIKKFKTNLFNEEIKKYLEKIF
ncbi:MAG TPA: ribonuclease P protein component [Candidatus Paceibacterota bacterium]|nr:ribonuclease P protein component [Candidatus Paceibacterota bacterium]